MAKYMKSKDKYYIYKRKKTKKERLSTAAKAGLNTGASSALLTGLLNSGKGKWKSAGKFGLIIGPAAAAASYVAGPKTKTFVKKAEQQVVEYYAKTNRLHELENVRNKAINSGKMLQKKAFIGAAAKLISKGAKKVLPKSWVGKGTIGADLLQPGAAVSRKMGVKQKPNLFDEIVFFGAPVTASAMAKPKAMGVARPLPSSKTPGTKKQEIRDYGHSSAGYDRGTHGQKLYH